MSHLHFLVKQNGDAVILEGACIVSPETRKISFTDCADVWVNACVDDWKYINDEWFGGKLFETCLLVPCRSHDGLSVDFGSMVSKWKKQ